MMIRRVLIAAAAILFAYEYGYRTCQTDHEGYLSPADTARFTA